MPIYSDFTPLGVSCDAKPVVRNDQLPPLKDYWGKDKGWCVSVHGLNGHALKKRRKSKTKLIIHWRKYTNQQQRKSFAKGKASSCQNYVSLTCYFEFSRLGESPSQRGDCIRRALRISCQAATLGQILDKFLLGGSSLSFKRASGSL